MNKHFNKNLIMRKKKNIYFKKVTVIGFVLTDSDEEKVRDYCHVTDKFRGAAHWNCNINLQLTKKVPVIFHNLRGYDSHLIFCKLDKFDLKISVVSDGLEKFMAFFFFFFFFLDKDLVFIDGMQFMNSSLDKLVKNLSDEDFEYLVVEFGSENLELLKQKDAYPYEWMNSFERFNEEKLTARKHFFSSTKE